MAPPVEVVAAITQPERPAGRGRQPRPNPVRTLAESCGVRVMQPERVAREPVLREIAELNPEVIIVASYGQILPERLLQIPRKGCVNLHPSLLPRWRGASPIQYAILEGDKVTGTTLMIVVKEMDAGPILAQEQLAIKELETAGELAARLAVLSANLLVRGLPGFLRGELQPIPQDETAVTTTRRLEKSDGDVDWRSPAAALARRVLAFNPWPTCYSFWGGRQLRLLRARAVAGQETPGYVSRLEGESLLIGTSDGLLALREAQLAGGRPVPVSDLIRGHPSLVGATLTKEAMWSSA